MIAARHAMTVSPGPGPEAWHEETLVRVEFTADDLGDGYCQLQIQVTKRTGSAERVLVDWGDGTSERPSDYLASHDYTRPGRYAIRIGGEAEWFRFWECYAVTSSETRYLRPQTWLVHWSDLLESAEGAFCGWSDETHGGLKGTVPRWGESITNTHACFERCRDIEGGFPEWPENVEYVDSTYDGCSLSGPLPAWRGNVTDCGWCYCGCSGATGPFLPWPAACTTTSACYRGCTGLAGEAPPWPSCAAYLNETYRDCPGLAGIIPPWPTAVRNVNECYMNCTGLTGAWTSKTSLLMPESKLRYGTTVRCYDTVTGCADAVRSLFWVTNWGGTKPRP